MHTCPEFATFTRNLYRCDAELFLPSSNEIILSQEGTTQGGPESMGFYAVTTSMLTRPEPGKKKLFYADDGTGSGKLVGLAEWWSELQMSGPLLGYFPNAPKTWLITKPQFYDQALELFPDINVTAEGHSVLGSFIGYRAGTEKFMEGKVKEWSEDIEALIKIAEFDPQLAYTAYVYGTARRWQFVSRTTPNIAEPLQKLEQLIRDKLIPAIINTEFCSDEMRLILRLPARAGSMSFQNPAEESDTEYAHSKLATAQLTQAIFEQHERLSIDQQEEEAARKEVSDRKAT